MESFEAGRLNQDSEQKIAKLIEFTLERRLVVHPEEKLDELDPALAYIKKMILSAFPEFEGELDTAIDLIKKEVRDTADFKSHVIQALARFVSERTTLEEIESRLKMFAQTENKQEILNRLLTYEVVKKELRLHIPPVFLDSPLEMRKLFVEGMSKLAEKLQQDLSLAEIEDISGSSWIIYKYPELIKSAGFEVVSRNEANQSSRAKISKENLIKTYSR